MSGMPNDVYATARHAQTLAARRRRQKSKRTKHQSSSGRKKHRPLNSGSPRQKHGMRAQEQAEAHLLRNGLVLLARNLHCRMGEIDLLMRDGGILVFVEVRLRQSNAYGTAAASVTRAKQLRLQRAAAFFMREITRRHFAGREPPCRFDVVGLNGDQPQWIKNAF